MKFPFQNVCSGLIVKFGDFTYKSTAHDNMES